jgi:hypothetical protein
MTEETNPAVTVATEEINPTTAPWRYFHLLPLEVEQPGVRWPAVLQQPGVDVGPLSAGRTGREDHMPGAQIIEPDGIARRDVLVSFHSSRAMPERAGEQERSAPAAFGGDGRGR